MKTVTQPLHRGSGDEDRAFERIRALTVKLIGDGGKQTMARADRSEPVLSNTKQPVP